MSAAESRSYPRHVRTEAGDVDNDPHGVAPTLVDVALEVDGRRYADLWLDTMRRGATSGGRP